MQTSEERDQERKRRHATILAWWKGLDERRGDRAELRRCRTPDAVLFCQAFHNLRIELGKNKVLCPEKTWPRLAAAAGLLAHVKAHDSEGPFAAQLAGRKPGSDAARLSGLRFRRLLRVEDHDELYMQLIRTIRLLGGRANVMSLADDMLYWSPTTRTVQKQWAQTYYDRAPQET